MGLSDTVNTKPDRAPKIRPTRRCLIGTQTGGDDRGRVDRHPLRERGPGRQVEAATTYHWLRALLTDELAIAPSDASCRAARCWFRTDSPVIMPADGTPVDLQPGR
jgi:hypothetical protein